MPVSPADWRDTLERRLTDRWAEWQVYDAYYEGDHRLAFVTTKFRDAFGGLFRNLTDNYMPLVVDSAAERLRVNGFRFGTQQDADDDAWEIWQANGMDATSNMVHTESIKLGESYWLVQPGDPPKITCEHPQQAIVAYAPGDRRERLAGMKMWQGDDAFIYANVYLPDRITKYRTDKPRIPLDTSSAKWERIDDFRNPLGVVPLVPIPNNPSMLRGGRSDLAGGILALQDAITKTLADMLIGSEYQALPQRVLLGVEPPRDPTTGRPISDIEANKSRLWYFSQPDAKAHEFNSADLGNFRDSMDGLIGDLAAQARIPIYYFRPQAISNLSAEALIGLDAGLVSKTNDKKVPFGEGHEEALRLAFRSVDADDPRAAATDAETIWADTESRSEAQSVDAAVKLSTIGVPNEALWERIGASPQQIDRWKAMGDEDALLAATEPPPPANGNVPSPQPGNVNAGQPTVAPTN